MKTDHDTASWVPCSSVFNDVLGPVMRGPSSSHTAGSYHIGVTARHLLGEKPKKAVFTFQPGSSYAKTFRPQGVMNAYACAMIDIPLTDELYFKALDAVRAEGIEIIFTEQELQRFDHPNTIEIELVGMSGRTISVAAKSTGGGTFRVDRLNGWSIHLDGKAYELLIECLADHVEEIQAAMPADLSGGCKVSIRKNGDRALIQGNYPSLPERSVIESLKRYPGVLQIWCAEPVYFVPKGQVVFETASEMVDLAISKSWSLGETVLHYESTLLGLSKEQTVSEMVRRLKVMTESVDFGFSSDNSQLRLLSPSAHKIREAEQKGTLAIGGIHAQAAARALAVMHTTCSRGVVCAAPTGGAAGTVPGVVLTLMESFGLPENQAAKLLFAAAGIGLITAIRATFSAEVAGCQVEIGVAGAMGAAAVVEFGGGTAEQAVNAAAISLQNTMGSVCDHVQSMCEIPCHTRNGVAASSAFTCADLVLGGYDNPIQLDDCIDASYSVGRMLPVELRCTAGGGLSKTQSALKIRPREFDPLG